MPAAKGEGAQHAWEHPCPRCLTAKQTPARPRTRNPKAAFWSGGKSSPPTKAHGGSVPRGTFDPRDWKRSSPGAGRPQAPPVARPHEEPRHRGAAGGHVRPRRPPARPYKRDATWVSFNVSRKRVPAAHSRPAILIGPHQPYLRAAPNARANGTRGGGGGVCLPASARDACPTRGGEHAGAGTRRTRRCLTAPSPTDTPRAGSSPRTAASFT